MVYVYVEPKEGVIYSPSYVDSVISSLCRELRDNDNEILTNLLASWREVRNRQDVIQEELRELLLNPGASPVNEEKVARLKRRAGEYGIRCVETTDTNWYEFVSLNGEIVLAVPIEDVD